MRGIARRGAIAVCLVVAAIFPLLANDSWLRFRGEPGFEAEYWGAVLEGAAPSFLFPLFDAERSGAGADLGWGDDPAGVALTLSTPTLWYDSPFTATTTISSPPSPSLPELQRALQAAPNPAELDLALVLGEGLSLRTDLSLTYRRDWLTGANSTLLWSQSDWFTGLLGAIEFPRKTWISYGSEHIGLAVGRFPSGIGAGHFGSTILNPEALYYDQALLHLGNEKVRFSWMLGTSSAQLSEAEADVQWKRNETTGGSYWDSLNDHDYSDGQNALKLFSYHLVEWRPWDWIRLGVTEFEVLGGATPSLDFVLPSVLWHNVYAAAYSNVAMASLLSLVPIDGLLLSGEFMVDDIMSADEPETAKPNSFAWQGSASYSLSPRTGELLSFGAEYTHVDRWTYVRWQPYLTFYQRQILPGGFRGLDYPLGYTYGPDCDQVGLWLRYARPGGSQIELSWEYIRKGPIYMGDIRYVTNIKTGEKEYIPVYYDYDTYAGEGALAAILARPDEIRNIFTLSWDVPLAVGLRGRIATSLGLYENYGHVAGVEERLVVVYAGFVWSPLLGERR